MKIPRNGFTLIEVLVALAILGMALATIMVGLTLQSARLTGAARQSEALQIAKSVLASAGATVPLRKGLAAGITPDGYQWRLEISNWGSEDDTMSRSMPAYLVEAEVSKGGKAVTLTTLHAGP